MKTLTDEKLVALCKKGDEHAIEQLFLRYKPILHSLTRGYFLLGSDEDDLMQEAMIGLYKAILSFNESGVASFKTFASICVRRNILSAIKKSNTLKNKILNDSLSLSGFMANDDDDAFLFLPYEPKNTDEMIMEDESFEETKKEILKKLSKLELKILGLYLKGEPYQQIATSLSITTKSVDNALSRIKNKLQFLK
ncbi:MAG: sigma-70 family RNA polymerase sigma factor [Christensenellales bacterium]|jgi:RNA polymerase sporulation-specific sigma factor